VFEPLRAQRDLLVLPTGGASTVLPRHTRRILAAVARGRGGLFFPPVTRRTAQRVELPVRVLAGANDAARLGAALAMPRFAALVTWIERVGAWCAAERRRRPRLFAAGVLAADNPDLIGPIFADAFALCAAASDAVHPALIPMLASAARRLRQFVRRVARDLAVGPLVRAGIHGPVIALAVASEETHNGGQRVLRVTFRTGGCWAYKARPATGERLFLAENDRSASIFQFLNSLPRAAGAVRLPTLRLLPGGGREGRAYDYHEWIARPQQWGTVRRAGRLRLEACTLTPSQAPRFWHRAGALAAACFAFGVIDLYLGNLLVGRRRGEREPSPYPVDLELFFVALGGLPDTGLVGDCHERGNHHVGFERGARWCTAGGPAVSFTEDRGVLRLRRRTRPWGRTEATSLVADTTGRVGFGPYVLAFLRGMFDLWTLLVVRRERVRAFVLRASHRARARVLLRSTAEYGDALDRWLAAPHHEPRAPAFLAEELTQLRRFDVPYFFTSACGGSLRWQPLDGVSRPAQHVAAAAVPGTAIMQPSAEVRRGSELELINIGVALRDAVAYVFVDLPARELSDPRRGTHLAIVDRGHGGVEFDWPAARRTVRYAWRGNRVQLEVTKLAARRRKMAE
jgi:hypothetical protein